MKSLSQLFIGLITAISSSLLVLAAISLAVVEGGPRLLVNPTSTQTKQLVTTQITQPPGTPTASLAPGQTIPPTFTPEPTLYQITAGPQSGLTACQPPLGWMRRTVLDGDTVDSLAAEAQISVGDFIKANCLRGSGLPVGSTVFMPFAAATPTETLPPLLPTQITIPCGPPAGWIQYTVRSGDTLYRISVAFRVSPYLIQNANCMTGVTIYLGQRLYVPNVATSTPVITNTPLPTNTLLPSNTPFIPSSTPGKAPTATPSHTPTPSDTPVPSMTPTTQDPAATSAAETATASAAAAATSAASSAATATSAAATASAGATASATAAAAPLAVSPVAATPSPASGTPGATLK